MPNLANVSDMQLYKRLYGLEETRQDWYSALNQAADDIIIQHSLKPFDAIVLPGDIMDAFEVGASAVIALNSFIKKVNTLQIPILVILGNHDKSPNLSNDWITFCEDISPYVYRLSLTQPVLIGDTAFYGTSHHTKTDIIPLIQSAQPASIARTLKGTSYEETPNTATKSWMVLHQSFQAWAPHVHAWELSPEHIPGWVHGAIIGDMHKFVFGKDLYGRPFLSPGSIESESISHSTTPGYVILDTNTLEVTHRPTQQRLYTTLRLKEDNIGDWYDMVLAVSKSNPFPNLPIIRVYYPAECFEQWKVCLAHLKDLFLRIEDTAVNKENAKKDLEEPVEVDHTTNNRDEAISMACKILSNENSQASRDVLTILSGQSITW